MSDNTQALLYNAGFSRKSVRKYDMTPLDGKVLAAFTEFLNDAAPLTGFIKGCGSIGVTHSILNEGQTKGLFAVKAPHYLAIYGDNKDWSATNAGFILEQADLYLSSRGLGACWLGSVKPVENVKPKDGKEFIIALAFGKPLENPHRELDGFQRKPLSEIAEGADKRLEYARLAPSAMNWQPWRYIVKNGTVHMYMKKHNPLMKVVYDKMTFVDMGIALCFLWLSSVKEGNEFGLQTADSYPPAPKGFGYFISMTGLK